MTYDNQFQGELSCKLFWSNVFPNLWLCCYMSDVSFMQGWVTFLKTLKPYRVYNSLQAWATSASIFLQKSSSSDDFTSNILRRCLNLVYFPTGRVHKQFLSLFLDMGLSLWWNRTNKGWTQSVRLKEKRKAPKGSCSAHFLLKYKDFILFNTTNQ